MPLRYRFGLDEDQRIRPFRPRKSEFVPESAIGISESWFRMFVFEHRKLLPLSEIFDPEVVVRFGERPYKPDRDSDE